MSAQAKETEQRTDALIDTLEGKKTAIRDMARETKTEAVEHDEDLPRRRGGGARRLRVPQHGRGRRALPLGDRREDRGRDRGPARPPSSRAGRSRSSASTSTPCARPTSSSPPTRPRRWPRRNAPVSRRRAGRSGSRRARAGTRGPRRRRSASSTSPNARCSSATNAAPSSGARRMSPAIPNDGSVTGARRPAPPGRAAGSRSGRAGSRGRAAPRACAGRPSRPTIAGETQKDFATAW